MSIQSIGNSTNTSKTANSSTPINEQGSQFGTNAFMKLLISELKNQDPLDPMQSRDMIAQLAQLSSVEKLDAMNTELKSLNTGISDVANNQAPGLIGKTITADTRRVDLKEIGSVNTNFTLNGNAASVDVVIRDKAGNAVRTLQLGEITAGSHNVTWDGKNDAANRVEAGEYTIGITAKDASGKAVTCLQQVSGIVNKVAYENGSAELIINNTRIKLRDVLSIS